MASDGPPFSSRTLDPAQATAGTLRLSTSGSKLDTTVQMLRDFSSQTNPQRLIEAFQHTWQSIDAGQYLLSLSRRGLERPWYRITRYARWPENFDPWANQQTLPLFDHGILGELIYADVPRILNDFTAPSDDPAYDYLSGARSLLTLPQYDGGQSLNMIVRMSPQPGFFKVDVVVDILVMSNLLGRAVNGLVLARKLEQTYAELEYELTTVGKIQRSLLPPAVPRIEGLDIAVSYQTATRSGGDYYDFFPFADGRLGFVIADVSGHGTPAAVVMAIVRTMLHLEHCDPMNPSELLRMLNERLITHTGRLSPRFVTAFYGIYDPQDRSIRYASAGHPPPLIVRRPARIEPLADAQSLPLGVDAGAGFVDATSDLGIGDTLIGFTDGITEAVNAQGEQYVQNRFQQIVGQADGSAQALVETVNEDLDRFTSGRAPEDDRTLVVMRSAS